MEAREDETSVVAGLIALGFSVLSVIATFLSPVAIRASYLEFPGLCWADMAVGE